MWSVDSKYPNAAKPTSNQAFSLRLSDKILSQKQSLLQTNLS